MRVRIAERVGDGRGFFKLVDGGGCRVQRSVGFRVSGFRGGINRVFGLPCIEEGAPADVVVYDADPRADLGVLARPILTILRGRLVA